MSKTQDIRDQSLEELQAQEQDARAELYHLVNEREQSKQFEKPHRIRLKRREIARLLTFINEKQKRAS